MESHGVVVNSPTLNLNLCLQQSVKALSAQNRVAVAGFKGCMVSGCHAGDVDPEAEPHAVATRRRTLNMKQLMKKISPAVAAPFIYFGCYTFLSTV